MTRARNALHVSREQSQQLQIERVAEFAEFVNYRMERNGIRQREAIRLFLFLFHRTEYFAAVESGHLDQLVRAAETRLRRHRQRQSDARFCRDGAE